MMRRGDPPHYHGRYRPGRPLPPPSSPSPSLYHRQAGPPPSRSLAPVRTPFRVVLDCGGHGRAGSRAKELEKVASSCPRQPERSFTCNSGVAVILFFRKWEEALDDFVYLWGRCLEGGPDSPTPKLECDLIGASYREEENSRLWALFAAHARALLTGDSVRKVEKLIDEVDAGIKEVTYFLKGNNSLKRFQDLQERKKGLLVEREQLLNRLDEFQAGIRSVLAWLEGRLGRNCVEEDCEISLFDLGGGLNWGRIHRVLVRECRRLENGLPIYSCRRKILSAVNSNQITVLVGETGSGKSTQLVQFLADTGLAFDGSIVCTQPRKIAVESLAQRVSEETSGCYMGNAVGSFPTYSSAHNFSSKIIFMTDHCLLHHCMNDVSFSGISYIIVDEAHERSLNTDLVLALVKKLLLRRSDLRLIIMSATADANKLSEYFCGCQILQVTGRSFPVEIQYIPNVSAELSWNNITKKIPASSSSYVSDVLKMVSVIHETEESGSVLAFLTAQTEVEWACENFQSPTAVVLPLHGKLSSEEQFRVFQNYEGKRKIIFSTNIAETSLTIPTVKYVVDSGMVKESRFEPRSGMNLLKVCRVSQSSAKQRAGRAGRTEIGKCYRLYSENEFQSMSLHQEPEIHKVHLGIAVLRILALGIKNVKEFDFVDAPHSNAIDSAIQNLVQLGAVADKSESLEMTISGRRLVKLGIEPRLGKIILECCDCGLSKEGLVLASVMSNASSIFCRVGSYEDKLKADCLKVPFCHRDGDLFTLLSVYKEWEHEEKNRNKWCWQNSINAKSLRRCQSTVLELENCLRHELNTIIPSYWKWDPTEATYSKLLKKIILSSLSENVAMYSGCEQLGYMVALTGEHVQLHPSCSLLIYEQKPTWVVFSEILSISNQFLVCVTAIDRDSMCMIQPPIFYDFSKLESQRMQMTLITGIGSHILRRLCGKGCRDLQSLVSRIKKVSQDNRADIIVDFEKGTIKLFAPEQYIEMASSILSNALSSETRWLRNECMEKFLFHGGRNVSHPVALFGAGAQIRHLELESRPLTVEIFHPDSCKLDDKELLESIEKTVPGIANFCIHGNNVQGDPASNSWGRITFLSSESVERAIEKLNGIKICDSSLEICPVRSFKGYHNFSPFHAVRAKICWPRRRSKGVAFVRCAWQDAESIVQDFTDLAINEKIVRCEISTRDLDCVVVGGIDKDISETELYDALRSATNKRIADIWLLRGDSVDHPSTTACEEALRREIIPFMSGTSRQLTSHSCRVEVFSPEPKDFMMKAVITFDESLHLEAAKALDHLQGKVLPGCLPWQKIECQQLFRSTVSCPRRVYSVIKKDLDYVLASFKRLKGVSYEMEKNEFGSYRVKLFANGTKVITDLRKPLEPLMRGKIIRDTRLTPVVVQLLLSREGVELMKSVESETRTCIMYDRRSLNLKIFGSEKNILTAEGKLVDSLLSLHENKPLEISLRANDFPQDFMKEVVQRYGPDLHGLKDKVPEAEIFLNTRHHKLFIRGTKELKQKVMGIISDIAQSFDNNTRLLKQPSETTCAICLCELEDPYKLGDCNHAFCIECLVEQCESAIRSRERFPLCCAQEGCQSTILLADLRSLLTSDKLEELYRASLGAFVDSSAGTYRFCPSPDCPSVYKSAAANEVVGPFVCGACLVETCTKCHLEYHPFISCEMYKEFKEKPDSSLMEWRKGKENVKNCPTCGCTIEKAEGCNHMECKCGKHICWACLQSFDSSDDCYDHLRSVHLSIS